LCGEPAKCYSGVGWMQTLCGEGQCQSIPSSAKRATSLKLDKERTNSDLTSAPSKSTQTEEEWESTDPAKSGPTAEPPSKESGPQ
jgi:hypothetical protein